MFNRNYCIVLMFSLCCALFYFVLEVATATGVFKHFTARRTYNTYA